MAKTTTRGWRKKTGLQATSSQKRCHYHLAQSSAECWPVSKFFISRHYCNFLTKSSLKIPPHLKCHYITLWKLWYLYGSQWLTGQFFAAACTLYWTHRGSQTAVNCLLWKSHNVHIKRELYVSHRSVQSGSSLARPRLGFLFLFTAINSITNSRHSLLACNARHPQWFCY